jgi:hypothetical protein
MILIYFLYDRTCSANAYPPINPIVMNGVNTPRPYNSSTSTLVIAVADNTSLMRLNNAGAEHGTLTIEKSIPSRNNPV